MDDREQPRRQIREWHNQSSGFFYTAERTIHRGKTPFQSIELVETTEFGRVLLLDGVTQVVEKNDWQYHEPMVHVALTAHDSPSSVLIIGGGDGGILHEVLKHPVDTVTFVELDRMVVEFAQQYLTHVHHGAFDDPRVTMVFTDGRRFVEDRDSGIGNSTYDVVIMDMTDPIGPSKMLYTREFFQSVRERMRDDSSMFVMHTESPVTRPAAFTAIGATLRSVFPVVRTLVGFIQMYGTLWAIAVCSQATDPMSLSGEKACARLRARGIEGLHTIDAGTWSASAALPPYVKRLNRPGPIITDQSPDFPDETPDNRVGGSLAQP